MQAAPSANELLHSIASAEKNLSYSGTTIVTRHKAPPMTLKVWRSGDKRRIEWMAPPVMRGDLLVDDGDSVWRYHSKENSAIQTRGAGEMDWARLSRTMNASLLPGNVTIAGRPTWGLALTPKGEAYPSLKVWVDQKNYARLRVDRLDAAGQTVRSMGLQNVRFGPVPAGQFQWTPPAGATVTRTNGTLYSDANQAKRAASWLETPSKLPTGYEFESAVVDPSGNGGQGEAWLRYANGINRFSIFEQRTKDNNLLATQKQGGGWFMQQGGSRYMILGLGDSEAKKVLESLK